MAHRGEVKAIVTTVIVCTTIKTYRLKPEVMASKTKIYIVLEYVDGGELFDQIAKYGRLQEDEARRYFQQLINVVDYCHSRGVYHRDLKIIQACRYLDETWDPKFMLIVAQKTHHTKFFQPSSDANVPPENVWGYLPVTDKKDGYSFIYPFGWQMIMLEGAKATTETVDALRTGAQAMKAMQKDVNIDDVDKTMDEINEQTENMKQIQEALSAPIGQVDFDEDELEAELEELEGAELEEQLLQPAITAPAAPVQVPGRIPMRPAPRKNTPEEDELAALQAEMAL